MPVDLFLEIKIPVVVVATFYSGMPCPQQIEGDITDTFERFFTLVQQYRPYPVALAHGRQLDQGLLPTRNRSEDASC